MDVTGTEIAQWALLGLAALATFMWRFIGVMIAGRIGMESRLFDWVNAVAYAMVAGLMLRIMFFPNGVLVETPLSDRLFGLVVALAIWWWQGRALLLGLLSGVAVFGLLTVTRAGAFWPAPAWIDRLTF